MKKKLGVSVLIVTFLSLVACQEGLSISSANDSSSEAHTSSTKANSSSDKSSSEISSSSNTSSSEMGIYYPIDPTPYTNPFANEITFELNMNKITAEEAEQLVASDISKYPAEQTTNKRTSINSEKQESHVTDNRASSTYSVKDYVETKHTINAIDQDKLWAFRKSTEYRLTTYFEEDDLIWHTTTEQLYYVKDGLLYFVYAQEKYYEGMEEKGTYESYYTVKEDFNIADYGGVFNVPIDGYAYFNETQNFNRIDRTVYNNFASSSSYYEADDYRNIKRDTKYDYYSSGDKGSFGAIAKDIGEYNFSDLSDYPRFESDELDKIYYGQDYLLNISNYFNFEEDYVTTSISKSGINKVMREERKEKRKTVTEECEIFYPDLTNFEKRVNK